MLIYDNNGTRIVIAGINGKIINNILNFLPGKLNLAIENAPKSAIGMLMIIERNVTYRVLRIVNKNIGLLNNSI